MKIIDFGISIADEDDYETQGTPNYMSPEMIKGDFSYESDIWSLGIILHYCATFKLPWEANNKYDLYNDFLNTPEKDSQHGYELPALNSKNVPKALKDLIKQMIIFNPLHRIKIYDAFQHEFLKQNQDPEEDITALMNEALTNIFRFSNMNIFQKNVYFYLAKICKTEEQNKVENQLFDVLDRRYKGSIDFSDFELIVHKYKSELGDKELGGIWKGLDYNKSGIIQYSDFLAANLNFKEYLNDEKLESAFNYYARDLEKFINMESFVETLMSNNLKVNEEETVKFFNTIENGMINFQAFKMLIIN